jgi:hypothetical protein
MPARRRYRTPVIRLGALLAALGCMAVASWAQGEPGEAPRQPSVLYYTGIDQPPVRGRTEVTASHARVVLEPVLQGDEVRHDFFIPNPRSEPLALRGVKACQGCILAGFTEEIAPEGFGRISILVVTDSVGGTTVAGTVRAETDDPARPVIEIEVELPVEEFAALEPYRVWLRGRAGEPIVGRSTIVPNDAYPFEITGIKMRKGTWLDVDWRTVDAEPGRRYEITLTNTRSRPGSYQDVLYVQTTHPRRPELKIRVEGRIAE